MLAEEKKLFTYKPHTHMLMNKLSVHPTNKTIFLSIHIEETTTGFTLTHKINWLSYIQSHIYFFLHEKKILKCLKMTFI